MCPKDELDEAYALSDDWKELLDKALTKDARLTAIKDRFMDVTRGEADDFSKTSGDFMERFKEHGPATPGIDLDEGLELLAAYRKETAAMEQRAEEIADAEKLFGLEVTRYPQLGAVTEEMDRVAVLYNLYAEHRGFVESNSSTLWDALDKDALEAGSEALVVKLRRITKSVEESSLLQAVDEAITSFASSIPLISRLKNPSMKPRHWKKLMEATGGTVSMNPKTFTLQGVFEMNLARYESTVDDVVQEAVQEDKIERDLRGVEAKWRSTDFEVARFSKGGQFRSYLLRPADDIKTDLEDDMLKLQTISASRFVGNFVEEVQRWSRSLSTVSEAIEVWFQVQQKWQYLEGIFAGNEDIKAQLPSEAKRFAAIDKEFKAVMEQTNTIPNVLDACTRDDRLGQLTDLGDRLDSCQKSLSEYLDSKRNAFPRFFFVSDDELLAVLGSSDPTGIQEHLLKLYNNVKKLGFGRGATIINSMSSSEGESFRFSEPVTVEGAVEDWMNAVDREMRRSLHAISKEGVFAYAHTPRSDWISEQLGMVTMVGSQIWWTWETEDTFRRVSAGDKYAMKRYDEKLTSQLMDLVALVREKLSKQLRKKVNTLLIVEVHARDIIDEFVRDSILDAREFAWESQLRFYWQRDVDDIRIRQCTGEFDYGYDYMGLNGRLVITPLTDRCYMTLTQALTFKLGGSPAGPAGTGKTETVKDLAKNLALPCFVQNCFAVSDHELLTEDGWVGWDEVKERMGEDEVVPGFKFAGYNPETEEIVYEQPSRVVFQPEHERTFVEFSQSHSQTDFSSTCSLVVTENHDMWVQRGDGFRKERASSLADDAAAVFEMQQLAAGGVKGASSPTKLPPSSSLNLTTTTKVHAFVRVFGFGLVRGDRDRDGDRDGEFCNLGEDEIVFLTSNLDAAGLVEGADYSLHSNALNITNSTWINHLSSKELGEWVWACDAETTWEMLWGMSVGSGCHNPTLPSTTTTTIHTTSIELRDTVCQLALHAGRSAVFSSSPKTTSEWIITLSNSQSTTPVLRASEGEVSRVVRKDAAWCVTMPSGFVIARRVRKDAESRVMVASRPVVCGNCGEGLDFKALGSTFSGLAQVGAWGCFDEFNRINIEVLSVVSAQLKSIQNALLYGREMADIGMGREIRINPRVGVFITMNPGYAGRTELPDNLKALFRPVTMVVPDLLQICQIMLFSEGFEGATVLAKKMTTLYALGREQLSKQYHYDFGLRALKSVLVMAGSLKREYATMPEEVVLMRSLRDSNIPKFVYEDVPLFHGLIEDLFPGLETPRVSYPELKAAAEEQLDSRDMRHDDRAVFDMQVDKVIQLYEVMLVRHTTMIVGPTGGGKTVVLETLQAASEPAFDKKVKTFVLNPKAQSPHEMYGVMDPVTREWQDGILSKLFRECNRPLPPGKENEMRWIVLDGDVDAVWVEDMNSVMDDNKLLTLANGERMQLQEFCKILVEVFDLQYASPATISRCGMTYVDPKNLRYRPYFWRWNFRRANRGSTKRLTEMKNLSELFENTVPYCVSYVLEGDPTGGKAAAGGGGEGSGATDGAPEEPLKLLVPMTELTLVKQLCAVLDAILPADGEDEMEDYDTMEGLFNFALVWSLGAALESNQRSRFSAFLARISSGPIPDNPYEEFFDRSKAQWVKWSTLVPEYEPPSPFVFHQILVPTTDSVLYTWLLDQMRRVNEPALFVGESGTAKTVTIQNALRLLDPEQFQTLAINFSSRTTSMDVQINIEANVDKRSGRVYGPPVGKRLMIFVDDLSMPRVDIYGTQQPIALLRFLIDREAMYDRRKDLDMRTYKDLMFTAAMAPPGGGRNSVDPRFVRLFSVFGLTPPSQVVLQRIYGSILDRFGEAFEEGARTAFGRVTNATLSLFGTIVEKLPPTPAKFHYIFNLRDLARIYEGMCQAHPDVCKDVGDVARRWRNECQRIFCDRLIDTEDADLVNQEIAALTRSHFSDGADKALQDPVLFGDFADAPARIAEGAEGAAAAEGESKPKYVDLGTFVEVRKVLDDVLESYNMEAGARGMNLVLFEQALDHMTRLLRILRMPRGNALLVGVGGSGKQSLTRLAAFTSGCHLFEISLARNYGEKEFREDLKGMYKILMEKPVVFLFTDAHVVEEGFLELINNILTTGMVPALYEPDERDSIANAMRNEVRAAGLVDTTEACWNFFVDRCRNNLHVVLAMSPSGETLRRRCRNFPGLVSSTVIDWFFPWPEDALAKVAEHFLHDETLPPEHREGVVSHIVHVHRSVVANSKRFEEELRRRNYVTPKNYLDFITNYRSQLASNRRTMITRTKRLQGGLTKLREAQTTVDRMSAELRERKVEVDAKTKAVNEMISDIKERQLVADASKKEATAKKEDLAEKDIVIREESAKANKELEEAKPALEAAAEALAHISPKAVQEVQSFANPPVKVKFTMMCVYAFRPTGVESGRPEWAACKTMINQSGFLTKLKEYDKDRIDDRMVRAAKKAIKEGDLTEVNVENQSKAAGALFKWVSAMIHYFSVAQRVNPLRMRVREMEKQQIISARELREIEAKLEALVKEIDELNTNYEKAAAELSDLQREAAIMEKQLNAASRLISGLGSERDRWAADVEELQGRQERLVGDCLLSAAFLSYLGPFTYQYRMDLMRNNWEVDLRERGLPRSDPFDLVAFMASEATVQGWVAEGLPADDHSVMNGLLTTQASRFPLCIDPQQQAVTWIKNREKDHGLKKATFLDGDFMRHLELAVQYGQPFLFENVYEEMDPMIDPILEKDVTMEGASKVIKLGDKAVEWHDDFRMYLTSKLANPHYSPEIMGKTMIINYSVTMAGLEDQLLNEVVAHERPELEQQFKQLIDDMSRMAQQLEVLEEELLRNLNSSTGNILENEELINTLETAKSSAVEITASLAESTRMRESINTARAGYKQAAKRGSILFFAMAGLSNIMRMYEISLSSFLGVFRRSLHLARADSRSIEARLSNIVHEMTEQMYDYTCTGIFERHKLMFSFQMTTMIMDGEGDLDRNELDFFLKGDTSLAGAEEANPAEWLNEQGWKDLLKLATMELKDSRNEASEASPLAAIVTDFRRDVDKWRAWFDLEAPEEAELPGGYEAKLSAFQRLLLVRCFRPDRVYNAVKGFVAARMGQRYVEPPVLNLGRIFSQSTAHSPVVFILSPGADPQSDIQALGTERGFHPGEKFFFLALGQGQASKAEELLARGAAKGHWVLLQNAHLLLSWMPTLERVLQEMTSPHEDFRLWLTTDPTDRFPLGILQRSLKVVTEPPDGLKLNMRSLYAKMTEAELHECPHPAYKPLVYVLCYLHAVVLERRKYGKIGMNVAYDFGYGDQLISRQLIALYLQKAYDAGDEVIPWGSIKYLVGSAMYGGRISDDLDRRILMTYMEEYMGDFLFDESRDFFFSRVGFDYRLPEDGELDHYRDEVERLPLYNSPAVFGLHPNAEIGYLAAASKDLWRNMIELQPRTAAASGGISREEHIQNVARDIRDKIPEVEDILNTRKRFVAEGGMPTPTQIVLLQELERWNALVVELESSLVDLERALKGEIGMSEDLESLGSSLFNGQIPAAWLRKAPATEKPLGSWMIHFEDRLAQYRAWLEAGDPPVIWLAGLHIPESYLTALVQMTCRRRGWPLDKSTLFTRVTKFETADEVTEVLEDGCYVRGLNLEGAAWDRERGVLRRQDPKVLVEQLPLLEIMPMEASRVKRLGTFRTPVYVTQARKNAMGVGLVFEADLATADHESHWVLQGVALCLNTDA